MKKYKWNIKTFINNLIILIGIIILIWFSLSYCEILFKNLSPNPNYLPINFFKVIGL